MKPALPVSIDRMPLIAREPSARPKITPAEVIALSLNGTMWTPGVREIKDDDMVVVQILRLLKEAGWKIEAI
jgi:hypothetical protein